MWFASILHEQGVITGDQFAAAVREQLLRRPLLGMIAVQQGKLTVRQVREIFSAQATCLKKPFGEIAIELGMITEEELSELLFMQSNSVPQLRDILVELGILTEEQVENCLQQARASSWHLADHLDCKPVAQEV